MALTENQKIITFPDFSFRKFDVVAGAIVIYKGAILNRNAAGYAVLGSDTTGERFLGIAYEELNQAATALAGDNKINVIPAYSGVTAELTLTGATIADVGREAYSNGDDVLAFGDDVTHNVSVGRVVDIAATNKVLVKFI